MLLVACPKKFAAAQTTPLLTSTISQHVERLIRSPLGGSPYVNCAIATHFRAAETKGPTGNNNAFLVKSKTAGGTQFSRDPFNLTNVHSKKNAGFINDKAVSVQSNEKGGVTLQTKKGKNSNKPAEHNNTHAYGKGTTNRR